MLDRRQFVWSFLASVSAGGAVLRAWGDTRARHPSARGLPFPEAPERVGSLFNGYILTVDPGRAVGQDPGERHRLYVLNAVLIDTATGRIAATYPALPSVAAAGDPVARSVSELPALLSVEHPPAPGITAQQLVQYWKSRGVDEKLLSGVWIVDLQGAVVTPGLIDDHFHVSSWSKKLPDEGERFGFYADIGDPGYYTDVSDLSRVCAREALWKIVADANAHLAETGRDQIYLHGYWMTGASEQGEDGYPLAFLFQGGASPPRRDPAYLINRIGTAPSAPKQAPADPCASDPSTWPPLDYESAPALLVHTSGQMCWYNLPVLEAFNQAQADQASSFPETAVSEVVPPSEEGERWEIAVDPSSAGNGGVLSQEPPFGIDLAVPAGSSPATRLVPFAVEEVDAGASRLRGLPMIPEVADRELGASPPAGITVLPFRRPIPMEIPEALWRGAEEYWGETPESARLAWGQWDPAHPYETNWYNGAERGLVQFVHDQATGAWRPSGCAEHYTMRDKLSAFVLDPLTPQEGMRQRRNLARWCHRHGITSVQDIMFYRRQYNPQEFAAYEGLSFDHRFPGGMGYYGERQVPLDERTGGLNLRVGLYYYVENAAGIDEVLGLAHASGQRTDPERLTPPEAHPEYPGWVRWTGWKLQLDGGTGARTLFTNAPMPKPAVDDRWEMEDEAGHHITFFNHGFGLLTMTNDQEQVLTSRETAALYWLVRESDPSSSFHNTALGTDWSFLAGGVSGWLERSIDAAKLSADLAKLQHVPLTAPDQLAEKIRLLVEQVQSGWQRTLMALARIWYEASIRESSRVPMPSQVACHNLGDGAVDLYVRAIKQIKEDVESFPSAWSDLPDHWQAVLPEDADLSAVRRSFQGERYRVEHLLNVSGGIFEDLHGPGGLDASTSPTARNVVLSTQPALLVLDGEAIRNYGFPYPQELWGIPDGGAGQLWKGVPATPRWHHHMPCPVFRDRDVPFSLSSDPPAVRDPRPAITLIGAVGRTPVEIDPGHWAGEEAGGEPERPVDYLVGKVYGPLGLTPSTPDNPMALSMEESLCGMTFWAAYVVGMETEIGAVAPPGALGEGDGWFADLVVWAVNPLAIAGPGGMHLEDLATTPEGSDPTGTVQMANAFIKKFLPRITMVGGVPVYTAG